MGLSYRITYIFISKGFEQNILICLTVGTQVGVKVRLMDWTVKRDAKRDISTTEINLSSRQSLHFKLLKIRQLQGLLEQTKQITTTGDGECLSEGLDPNICNIYNLLRSGKSPFQKTVPRTLINSDTFTVMFSCPTIKSLQNLWKLAEDGDLSQIMKSLIFDHMKDQLPLESLNLESTIDTNEYRALQKTLEGHTGGADTSTFEEPIQSKYRHWTHS